MQNKVIELDFSPRRCTSYCCVPGCSDRSSSRHKFPMGQRDNKRYEVWLRNVGNPSLFKLSKQRIGLIKVVCRRHFLPKFWRPGFTQRLWRNAIPTENLPPGFPVFTSIPDEDIPPIENADITEESETKTTAEEKSDTGTNDDDDDPDNPPTPEDKQPIKVIPKTTDLVDHPCCVPGCTPKDKIRMEFPSYYRDKDRLKVWLKAINNPELESVPMEDIPPSFKICRRHFEPKCFLGYNRMKADSVPTLYVSDPEPGKRWQYQKKLKDKILCTNADTNKANKTVESVPEKPADKRCRICLKEGENFIPLSYNTYIDGEGSQTMCELLNKCFKLQLDIVDNKPKLICVDCAQMARSAYEFRKTCETSEQTLQKESVSDIDPNTIVCFIDVEEFEKIEKMSSAYNPKETSKISNTAKNPIEANKHAQKNPKKTEMISIGVNTLSYINKIPISGLKKIKNITKKCDKNVGVNFKCKCMLKTQVKPRSTICVQCRRNFHKKLKFKLYTNVLIVKKRFKCIDCNARFASPRNLNLHLLAHLNSNNKHESNSNEDDDDSSSPMLLD